MLQAPEAWQSPLQHLSSTGDSGGPLIVHKRSRFIQVSVHFLVCGGDAQGQHEPWKGKLMHAAGNGGRAGLALTSSDAVF